MFFSLLISLQIAGICKDSQRIQITSTEHFDRNYNPTQKSHDAILEDIYLDIPLPVSDQVSPVKIKLVGDMLVVLSGR